MTCYSSPCDNLLVIIIVRIHKITQTLEIIALKLGLYWQCLESVLGNLVKSHSAPRGQDVGHKGVGAMNLG